MTWQSHSTNLRPRQIKKDEVQTQIAGTFEDLVDVGLVVVDSELVINRVQSVRHSVLRDVHLQCIFISCSPVSSSKLILTRNSNLEHEGTNKG